MCGEYRVYKPMTGFTPGSPPHVWRILQGVQVDCEGPRITSTCVENTQCKSLTRQLGRDHLHMCGEYWCSINL